MSEDSSSDVQPKKRNALPQAEVSKLIEGLPCHEKASFLMVGHPRGVRIAIPKTSTGVSRAHFYGMEDYSIIPQLAAIEVYSKEQRKEQRKGGIMADVSFEAGLEAATEALKALLEVIRNAPPPPERGLKKPSTPKEPKVVSTDSENES